ncbi:D-(-)-3-hydroxybutyrate oligomer hydrolase [Candidatus Magnetomoraceae bacterium gMMP-15]
MKLFLMAVFCIFIFICCSSSDVNKLTFNKKLYDGGEDGYLFTASLESESDFAAPNKMPLLDDPEDPTKDPENPTPEDLRSLAIFMNYRGLVDTSSGSGFGTLYGPKDGDEPITGKEYIEYYNDGSQNITMIVQIPDTFDPENPRIITAPSSGSRGIYGAIGTAGEWGLKHGFAVAYTDKGTGMGVHDLDSDTVNLIDGTRTDAASAGNDSHFTAKDENLKDFKEDYPHRVAFKHAHSQNNPEKNWGKYVLESIRFAFRALNDEYGDKYSITKENTLVIASSVSNGGGASIRAAEQDTEGLIDGVAVSEPNVMPKENSVIIKQGSKEWTYPNHSKGLLDYQTFLNIYQPCACLAQPEAPYSPNMQLCQNRCASLKAKGLLSSETLEEQAAEAQKIINDYGILEDQNLLQPSHYNYYVVESIAVTYANAYGKFSISDNLCGFSFAGFDQEEAKPVSLTKAQLAALFGNGNGIPPTGGVMLINNNSQDGPVETRSSISDSGTYDMNLDGALCLRRLTIGEDESGNHLESEELAKHERIKAGISEIQATGDLHGLPVVIVHGRNDAILSPNHTSRAYFGLNKTVEGENSNLHYYEITNAHHLDAFNGLTGFDSKYIPLHYYYGQALDLLYDHLKNNTSLPPSQVVRTIPRGVIKDEDEKEEVPALTKDNVPPILSNPAEGDKITFENGIVNIP